MHARSFLSNVSIGIYIMRAERILKREKSVSYVVLRTKKRISCWILHPSIRPPVVPLPFPAYASLDEMVRAHTDYTAAGAAICTLCGTVIKQRKNLKRHFQIRHFDAGVRYECPACKRRFGNKYSFSNHVSFAHKELKGLTLDRYAISC